MEPCDPRKSSLQNLVEHFETGTEIQLADAVP